MQNIFSIFARSLYLLGLTILLTSCGATAPLAPLPTLVAPDLANSSAKTYGLSQPVTISFENNGGAPSGCSASPELPAGLTLVIASGTCQIEGTTPDTATGEKSYIITATNAIDLSATSITITIDLRVPNLANAFEQVYTVNIEMGPILFTNRGGAVAPALVVEPNPLFLLGSL